MQVTYIYNSGFLVELDKHILLFDYYQGTIALALKFLICKAKAIFS